jgi:hypothetical protein
MMELYSEWDGEGPSPLRHGDPRIFSYEKEKKWWRKLMKHKKRRTSLRKALYKQLTNLEEDVIFPLDKKPWIFYW